MYLEESPTNPTDVSPPARSIRNRSKPMEVPHVSMQPGSASVVQLVGG